MDGGVYDLNRNVQDVLPGTKYSHPERWPLVSHQTDENTKGSTVISGGLVRLLKVGSALCPPWLPSLSAEAILVLSFFWPYLEISPLVLLYKELSILQGADREEWGQTGRKWQGSSQQQEVASLVSLLFTLNLACSESSPAWLPAAQSPGQAQKHVILGFFDAGCEAVQP